MACKYPMWRIPWDKVSWAMPPEMEKRVHNGGIRINRTEYEYYKKVHPLIAQYIQENPCGQCAECRLALSRQWADRCYLESKQYEDNAFVTLTYDNDHLRWAQYIDPETGETDIRPTLYKKDLQDFLKRLRRYFKYHYGHEGIRFFGGGEYGDETSRPHLHIILFNCAFPDLKISGESDPANGVPYYTSKILNEIWGKGATIVAECNWETCAYVARYVMKKQTGKAVTLRNEMQKFLAEQAKVDPLPPLTATVSIFQPSFILKSIRLVVGDLE